MISQTFTVQEMTENQKRQNQVMQPKRQVMTVQCPMGGGGLLKTLSLHVVNANPETQV